MSPSTKAPGLLVANQDTQSGLCGSSSPTGEVSECPCSGTTPGSCWQHHLRRTSYKYTYPEPEGPLFWTTNHPKYDLFLSRKGSIGFKVCIYISTYIWTYLSVVNPQIQGDSPQGWSRAVMRTKVLGVCQNNCWEPARSVEIQHQPLPFGPLAWNQFLVYKGRKKPTCLFGGCFPLDQ